MDARFPETPDYLELAADIVAAYVGHNAVAHTDLPQLIIDTHTQLRALAGRPPGARPVPAVPINRSVRDDAITCLECGRSFKSLRRHMMVMHEQSLSDYAAKWSLPPNYPFSAPAYSAERSATAKRIGLGRKRT